MRILYVNHTAEVSGGERSLLDLLAGLPPSASPLLATPHGALELAAEEIAVATTPIRGTAGSLKLHPLHTPRALAEMGAAGLQLRRAARSHRADVIHANSIRAGLAAGLAWRPEQASVVHVRDCLPPSVLSSATLRLLAATATVIVANSRYTADSLLARAPNARVEIVHNAVNLERWNPGLVDRARARERLGEPIRGRLLLGVVAQLTPWKGQDTAIEALAQLSREGLDAHLLLIGSAKFVDRATRLDNRAYVERLDDLALRLGVAARVSRLGEREDVPELVRALDVLLLPSWEEPFGRALVEAMAMGVPVLATSVGGPSEIIHDGGEGWLLAPREPRPWADAIRRLHEDPLRAAEMGAAGRRRVAQAFTIDGHVRAMLAAYERALRISRARRRTTARRA